MKAQRIRSSDVDGRLIWTSWREKGIWESDRTLGLLLNQGDKGRSAAIAYRALFKQVQTIPRSLVAAHSGDGVVLLCEDLAVRVDGRRFRCFFTAASDKGLYACGGFWKDRGEREALVARARYRATQWLLRCPHHHGEVWACPVQVLEFMALQP